MNCGFEYKNKSGIYVIKNTINGKEYIGSAISLYNRFHTHKCQLINRTHSNNKLLRSYKKYGDESFVFEIIELCEKKDLIIREQFWIDTKTPVLNICKIAGNTLGFKLSKKTKNHLSDVKKGKTTQSMLGKKHKQSTKDLIGKKAKERGVSKNFLEASKLANTGRKHSKVVRDKMALKQRKITPTQSVDIIEKRLIGIYQMDIAKEYGISQRLVVRVEKRMGIYGTKDYVEAQEKRFENHIKQLTMF